MQRSGKEGVVLSAMRLMRAVEVESVPPGKRCPTWKIWSQSSEMDHEAITLVLDLAEAFKRDSLPVVWSSATHLKFTGTILRVLCGYFEHQRRVQWVEVELFAPSHCVAACSE